MLRSAIFDVGVVSIIQQKAADSTTEAELERRCHYNELSANEHNAW